MTDAWVDEYNLLVSTLAMEYSRKYSIIETADIRQILWMWFVTHPNKYIEWSKLPPKDKEKLIAKSLRNAALKYCGTSDNASIKISRAEPYTGT